MLQALKSMKPDDRIILMSHLNDKAKDALYETVAQVLQNEKLPEGKRRSLIRKLKPHKEAVRKLALNRHRPASRRRSVVQLGGSPMGYVLDAALPLFVSLFAQ